MSRLVRYQLVAFVVVTVLGVTFAMLQYVGLPRILGFGQYRVSVALPAAGGLYANAVVTERGVPVGKVADIRLGSHGAIADVSLDDGVRIPARLHAAVRNTSAVGEQYLELTPQQAGPPYLQPGAVVPEREVSLPTPPGLLLTNLSALLDSVPRQQLNNTINELYLAFNGSGPDLQRLLDSSSQLLAAAHANLAPTSKLLSQLEPVLRTQQARSADILAFSRNLAAFTQQLRASNSDLSGSLRQLPGFTTELNALVGQVQPTVPLLLANLTAVGRVFEVYVPNLRQILVILPADINDVTAAIMTSSVPGSANMDFKSTINNPPPCQQGYSTPMRPPTDTSRAAPPNPTPYCTVPHSSPLEVRGARNNPCPNNPALRAATAAGCGLIFQPGAVAAAPAGGHGPRLGGGQVPTSAATYDPASGLFFGPDGALYSAGAGSTAGTGPTTLGQLLQQTLGN
jgi:phospholipid/cholesterol/gamma-HCH transport system substrate-binding protein